MADSSIQMGSNYWLNYNFLILLFPIGCYLNYLNTYTGVMETLGLLILTLWYRPLLWLLELAYPPLSIALEIHILSFIYRHYSS